MNRPYKPLSPRDKDSNRKNYSNKKGNNSLKSWDGMMKTVLRALRVRKS
jgi:hypothetical protein